MRQIHIQFTAITHIIDPFRGKYKSILCIAGVIWIRIDIGYIIYLVNTWNVYMDSLQRQWKTNKTNGDSKSETK